jgi:hypothetical protein
MDRNLLHHFPFLSMQFPLPTLAGETDQHTVVTLTLIGAPVTVLGISCQLGFEPF